MINTVFMGPKAFWDAVDSDGKFSRASMTIEIRLECAVYISVTLLNNILCCIHDFYKLKTLDEVRGHG